MRRSIMLLLVSATVLALGAPAEAAKPVKTTYDSVNANAFWYFEEQLSPATVKRTTWYVGVYRSTDGTFSDLYVETATCTTGKRGESCTWESLYGYSDLSGDGEFTIDEQDLTSAHLAETYLLQSFDEKGEPAEEMSASIVADWTGIDDIEENSGKSSYCDDYFCSKSTWDEAFRSAEADATVNGEELGETYDAWLARYHSQTTEWTK